MKGFSCGSEDFLWLADVVTVLLLGVKAVAADVVAVLLFEVKAVVY